MRCWVISPFMIFAVFYASVNICCRKQMVKLQFFNMNSLAKAALVTASDGLVLLNTCGWSRSMLLPTYTCTHLCNVDKLCSTCWLQVYVNLLTSLSCCCMSYLLRPICSVSLPYQCACPHENCSAIFFSDKMPQLCPHAPIGDLWVQ